MCDYSLMDVFADEVADLVAKAPLLDIIVATEIHRAEQVHCSHIESELEQCNTQLLEHVTDYGLLRNYITQHELLHKLAPIESTAIIADDLDRLEYARYSIQEAGKRINALQTSLTQQRKRLRTF